VMGTASSHLIAPGDVLYLPGFSGNQLYPLAFALFLLILEPD